MRHITKVHRAEGVVGELGDLTLQGMPFESGEPVEVLAIPRTFPNSLVELFMRPLNPPQATRWEESKVPAKLERFEDIVFLFELSPKNRGIIRMDFDEAAAVFKAVTQMKDPVGVEIGRFTGGSTLMLAVAVGSRGKVTSIDISPRDDEILGSILLQAGLADRVDLIVADANNVVQGGQYDFVFIDGDHTYEGARRDHNRWGSSVKPGGLIIHHDMAHERPSSTDYKELAQLRSDILQRQGEHLELIREAGSIAIFQRKSSKWVPV